MRAEKSDFAVYSSSARTSGVRRSTNIVDLINKNRKNEKREKILRIYTLLGFAGLILFFGSIIFI